MAGQKNQGPRHPKTIKDETFVRRDAGFAPTPEERLSAFAKTMPGAFIEYVRSPSGEEKINFVSSGCKMIWDLEPQELEQNPALAWSTVVPEHLTALHTSIKASEDDLSDWQHRWRITTNSGYGKWLQAYGSPSRLPDGSVAWHTLILDVTIEQEAQIALAQNVRLLHESQKLESIGRLAGGVAHDFNNLLAVILGNAETIDRSAITADTNESLSEITEAAQKGAALVKQLLSFARKSDLRTNVFDIQRVMSDVDALARRILPANIALQVVEKAGLWSVNLDRSMLESAIFNIVINARDAMKEGGSITIEASNIRIDEDYISSREEEIEPGRYVMLAITDTGSGIDEDTMPYIFEPFFTTKGPGHGSGLGLAMVQGFAKQSSGTVRIYSEAGHGTSVKLFFPAIDNNHKDDPRKFSRLSMLGRKTVTVLLVEDDHQVRKVVEKAISSAGFGVISCETGDKALEHFSENADNIDLIVTDVVMPGKIQGPQFVRLARKIKSSIPVLYMSGYPHEANVHGNGVRATDISLMKPIRRSDLIAALNTLMQKI